MGRGRAGGSKREMVGKQDGDQQIKLGRRTDHEKEGWNVKDTEYNYHLISDSSTAFRLEERRKKVLTLVESRAEDGEEKNNHSQKKLPHFFVEPYEEMDERAADKAGLLVDGFFN